MFSVILNVILISAVSVIASVQVRFNQSPVVEAGRITLSDIAVISGDPVLTEQLASIEVGRSAKPGKVRIMQTATLKQFFIKPKVALENIEFFNEGRLEVQTNAAFLSSEKIEDAIRAEIEKYYKENAMYEVSLKGIPKSVPIPLENWSLEVEKKSSFKPRGRTVLYAVINHGTAVYKRIKVQVEIKVYEDVVFTTRYVRRGIAISENDLETRNVETTDIRRPVVNKKEDIVGKEFKRSLNKDRMVVHTYINEPFLVKRGTKTRIKTRVGEGVIYATAVARENGRKGDVVRVQNLSSKKMIRGTVDEHGDVWVIN